MTTPADGGARLLNGRLTVAADEDGSLRFLHTATGRELLSDKRPYQACPQARSYTPLADGTHRVEQRFEAYDDERIHGLGQHLHGHLDQKGLVIDLVQGNTVVTIPFLHSSRGYSLLCTPLRRRAGKPPARSITPPAGIPRRDRPCRHPAGPERRPRRLPPHPLHRPPLGGAALPAVADRIAAFPRPAPQP